MFAGCGVQAGICQAEALDRFAAEDVGFDNLVDVGLGDVPIPDRVRVDDDVGTVLALIEAAGLIGAYFALETALGELLFEEFLQLGFRQRIAASAGMARRALVSADENMFFELGHQTTAVVRAFATRSILPEIMACRGLVVFAAWTR